MECGADAGGLGGEPMLNILSAILSVRLRPETALVVGALVVSGCDGSIAVRGLVYGPNGLPLEGAKVSLSRHLPSSPTSERRTDETGCFILHAVVAPGRANYRLHVHRSGFKPASAVVFSGDLVNEVEIRMASIQSTESSESVVRERTLSAWESRFDVVCPDTPAR